jgi:hypothetical protein
MKTFTKLMTKKSSGTARKCLFVLLMSAGMAGFSQTLTQEFIDVGYTLTDLGSINLLPPKYGGLTIRPDQPNTLYIGGDANVAAGKIYTVALVRDPVTHHITGFGSDAVIYSEGGNNDGGIFFAPNGTLLFTRYSMNELGQILPDNTYLTTSLTQYGIGSSVGSLALVPAGYPGAGNLIFASYNWDILYNVPYTIDGSGQYILANQTSQVSVTELANGPEGIAYIPSGSLGFPNLSMAISSYGNGTVVVYEVGNDGLPNIATGKNMVTGLTGAEGAWIDPVTGDFIFSTFGGGDKIIRISGFVPPSGIGDEKHSNTAAFSVFPNPTHGPVKIKLSDPGVNGSIEIYNILGEKIMNDVLPGNGIYETDLSSQPEGMFIIRVRDGEKVGNQRLIKQ